MLLTVSNDSYNYFVLEESYECADCEMDIRICWKKYEIIKIAKDPKQGEAKQGQTRRNRGGGT